MNAAQLGWYLAVGGWIVATFLALRPQDADPLSTEDIWLGTPLVIAIWPLVLLFTAYRIIKVVVEDLRRTDE